MSIEELKKLQTRIIKKNKICNYITTIVLLIVLSLTVLACVKNKNNAPINIVIVLYMAPLFEIIIGIMINRLIKTIINGKDISLFEKEYKSIFVSSSIREVFKDVTYKPNEGFTEKTIEEYGMINTGDRFTSNDYISGIYKNIKFEQSDIHIQEKHVEENENGQEEITWETIFEGRYMIFDFSKEFKSDLQVVSLNFFAESLPVQKVFEEIKMEDIEFNKKFNVYAETAHDAFYILTPHLMQRIKQLYEKLDYPILLCFTKNRLHIAINNWEDSLEYNVFEPINEKVIQNNITKDIKLITDFVNELNLDNDVFKK